MKDIESYLLACPHHAFTAQYSKVTKLFYAVILKSGQGDLTQWERVSSKPTLDMAIEALSKKLREGRL